MNFKKVLFAGVAAWLVQTIIIWLTCGWLFTWVYEIPPNIWLGPEAMMSPNNMIWSNLFSLIANILFVLGFAWLYKGIPGSTGVKKGIIYGLIIWLVAALPGMGSMPFYMTIASGVVVYWVIQALVINLIRGAIVGAIYKQSN